MYIYIYTYRYNCYIISYAQVKEIEFLKRNFIII